MEPQINEMIYALEKLDPSKLAFLRKQYPEYANILEPGIKLGTTIPVTEENALKVKAEICSQSNAVLLAKCEKEFPGIRKRIARHKRLTLISQVLSTVCSATVVTSLVAEYDQYRILSIIFGVTGIVVSLMPVINDYLITGLNNKKIDESYEQLVKLKLEIDMLDKELAFFIKTSSGSDQVTSIIQECNEKTTEVMKGLLLS